MYHRQLFSFLSISFLCSTLTFADIDLSGKCLDIPEVTPKRFFVTGGKSLDINLETSTRPTHLLATHIFYIFATEVLGYPRVTMTVMEDYFNIEVIMERLSSYSATNHGIPPATINLEVWTSPEYDPFEKEFVKEVGSVGPPGRFGWYIPRRLNGPIKEYYKLDWNDEIQEVHWSFFLNDNFASKFALDSTAIDMLIKTNAYHKYSNNEYVCPDGVCVESMYTPSQCDGKNCAVLLAPDFRTSDFLIHQVNEIRCLVKILWLGNNLKSAVRLLEEYYAKQSNQQSFMFFHWFPGDLVIDETKFVTVKFKNNELYNFTNNLVNGYKYEMHRLVKMVWSKLEVDANPLFLGVRSFKLRREDYVFLFDLKDKGYGGERKIACEWMRNNTPVWANWKKTYVKPTINIGGIFPMSAPGLGGWGVFQGAKAAVEFINRSPTLLKDYNLNLMAFDGKCQPESVMSTFLDLIVNHETFKKLVGVLGPACTETVEPIAPVSKQYNVVVVSYGAEGTSFSDRSKYPYFFRTIGENLHYKYAYLALFKQFGWKRVAALTEDGQKYTEYISLMSDDFPKNGIAFIANKKFPRGRNAEDMRTYLTDLKKQSVRIIIADVMDHDARLVMCEAYQLEMTAKEGYVWFLPVWLNNVWYDTDINNNTEKINCSTAEMIEAANGYFSLAHAYYGPDDAVMQENITIGEWKKLVHKSKPQIANSEYAGFAYDGVWTFALALNQLVNENSEAVYDLHSKETAKQLVEYIQKVDFHGVSGHIKFRGGPSRFSTINLVQWINGTKSIVGNFFPNITDDKPEILGGDLVLNGTNIIWLNQNGGIPEDGTPPPPSCALEALAVAFNVECQTAVIILNIIVAGVLLIGVVAVCYYMKRRYDSKVEKTKNYMRSLGIPFDLRNASDLDKWEIRRECVVINRKLGEGAFGTVYGGEVSLENNDNWTAAAVKTLKVGSTTEEKLDFLSEAEAMKRFDHKNIVKLLGVCTKEEPVYTIMEFMLYGDLKTYLLARRHLVKSDIEESEEVSPKRLTNMALDVARGLSYLAEIKFVHRDIASRNCLINAQRSVKIGDFGMTRAMFDNDYYKFTRRGMLPVRWMSPESLALGVFTPASDIWSFGILLYEIITFGNFPFQGKSNAQVLELVKDGQTLEIPKGTKPQLVGLMKSCWKRESKERPAASQIVEFLANNPRLLSPCLDVPISSVQIGDSDQLELTRKDLKVSPTKSTNGSTFQAPSSLFDEHVEPEGIPLEICGANEPLLGQSRASSSNLLSRLGVGSKRESEEDDEYLEQNVPDSQDNTNV
ncbi:uncharacterized protein LOC130900347 [Diorhabda carinulata]|uniref:uncharacterized protein LOC130900347 n=1 Tax=Diorhabda carinulata TaxID=1163345 RepID=UPI0025A1CA1F|nr:uncharacterized protein LOC130900347 [Diorhabda carinulata]XP_057666875.1 uncharacterized protein LOC130900347 [Diorhabda carinulata]